MRLYMVLPRTISVARAIPTALPSLRIVTASPCYSSLPLHQYLQQGRNFFSCVRKTPVMDDLQSFNNIDGSMQGPIPNLIEKHLGTFDHDIESNSITLHSISGRSYKCKLPSADEFLKEFPKSLKDNKLLRSEDSPNSWHSLGEEENALLLSSDSTIKTNLNKNDTDWTKVQAVGRCYAQEEIGYKNGLLQLSELACRTFIAQPTRKLLHGFYLRGQLLEAWVFDRAGLYCSTIINTQEDFPQFMAVVLSYQTMTNTELGEHKILQYEYDMAFVELKNATNSSLHKIYLDKEPLRHDKKLTGAGVVVYRAKTSDSSSWDYVVKTKWRRLYDRAEKDMMELVERHCKWEPHLHMNHYEEVAKSQDYRPNFDWGRPRRFIREDEEAKESDKKGMAAYTKILPNPLHRERSLLCCVTSPVGRPLGTFQSLPELVSVLHDILGCHKSLYFDAGIIHRDISAGNIIILDNEDPQGPPRGLLIDFDYSILKTDNLKAGTNIIGTKIFMAIEALKWEVPTYRHDLESLMYVFVWLLIKDGGDNLPDSSKLCRWFHGSYTEAAACKLADMEPSSFERILDEELPAKYAAAKQIALEWRSALFPLRDGSLWMGTDTSDKAAEQLYAQIMGVLINSDLGVGGWVELHILPGENM